MLNKSLIFFTDPCTKLFHLFCFSCEIVLFQNEIKYLYYLTLLELTGSKTSFCRCNLLLGTPLIPHFVTSCASIFLFFMVLSRDSVEPNEVCKAQAFLFRHNFLGSGSSLISVGG